MLTVSEFEYVLRRDFMAFTERSFYELNPQTRFIPGPHLEVIASKLEGCRTGKIRRLVINLPPRSLKSHAASIAFVAWCLGHDPAKQIICVSYGQDLADKLARDCRTLMNSALYKRLFRTRLADRQAVDEFTTSDGGMRMSTSVGGVLTGRGGDLIIIDDPLKPTEAMSETGRKAVNDWYDNTLLSRLNDKQKGCIILIMQRLHQDDLVGHVLEQEDWDVVSFPAIAEEDETHVIDTIYGRRLFQRKEGEALHPARENRATLEKMRETMGSYDFVAQYQQNPIPIGGNLVKTEWLRYYDRLPDRFTATIQSWDTANKSGQLNDYSVGTTWGVYDRFYYLLDVFRRRLNYPNLKRAVVDLRDRFKPDHVLIEDKASGTQLIQDLQNGCIFYGVTPCVPPPGADKQMRLYAETALFEGGNVLLPHSASWLDEYVKEITGYPGTKFDDQVDSTTQALSYLRSNDTLLVWEKLGRGW